MVTIILTLGLFQLDKIHIFFRLFFVVSCCYVLVLLVCSWFVLFFILCDDVVIDVLVLTLLKGKLGVLTMYFQVCPEIAEICSTKMENCLNSYDESNKLIYMVSSKDQKPLIIKVVKRPITR